MMTISTSKRAKALMGLPRPGDLIAALGIDHPTHQVKRVTKARMVYVRIPKANQVYSKHEWYRVGGKTEFECHVSLIDALFNRVITSQP